MIDRRVGRTVSRGARITAIAAVVTLIASAAAPARASTYKVRQCSAPHGFPGAGTPLLTSGGSGAHGPAYVHVDQCSQTPNSWSQVRPEGSNSYGTWGQLGWIAPAGTVIASATADYLRRDTAGYLSYVLHAYGGETTAVPTVEGEHRTLTLGTSDAVGVGVYCSAAAGCPADTLNTFAQLGNLRLTIRDGVPPERPDLGGGLFGGGWVRGAKGLAIAGADLGAGVDRMTISINGTTSELADFCSPGVASGYIAELEPCRRNVSYSGGRDTAKAPFREGENAVQVCVHEYGDDAERRCQARTVRVDNVAPGPPRSVTIAQGAEWQGVNDFDLRWDNPAESGERAPIEHAYVRISGDRADTGWMTFAADGAIDDLRVPGGPGEYELEIVLADAAGNHAPSTAVSRKIRFDDVPPRASLPAVAGRWLGKAELDSGFEQRWGEPRAPHPVSGIRGYALVVDQSASTDPCDRAGAGGAATACSGGEVNFPGLANRSTTLGRDDLGQGDNWVHLVPVSGAGVKAERIEHTRLKVDTVAPNARLNGGGDGWSRRPVRVTAEASDERSGMVDTDEFGQDRPPATFIEIDGIEAGEPDAAVSGVVSGDGIHRVRWWARDLAGNVSEQRSATVRIDGSRPVGHLKPEKAADPELIEASVSDALSGIASAELHYREGDGRWVKLDSVYRAGRDAGGGTVSARMDSTRMSRNGTYRFRVTAADAAGNSFSTTRLANGDQRRHVGPLRRLTTIERLTVDGERRRALAPYGSRASVAGRLVGPAGRGIRGVAVDIVQDWDAGSKRRRSIVSARTDGRGLFAARLPKGPGRLVTARFAGDERRLGSASPRGIRLAVRGRVAMRVSKRRVRPGGAVRFLGRVGRLGAAPPVGGKLVEVQVKVGRRWKAVERAIRADRSGRFSLRYRFGTFYVEPITFRFRARVIKEAGWPYRPVRSGPRQIRIVP